MRVEIDLFSDFICPWSYIGKRQLDGALTRFMAERPDAEVVVRWTPYLLDPSIPAGGLPFRKSLEAKLGGASGADAMIAQIRETGQKAGVAFALERITTLPSTLRAHRLIYKAQTDGLPRATVDGLVESIFSAYFLHGADIGDPAVLANISLACGQEEASVMSYLLGDDHVQEVNALARLGGAMGIGGVPCFVFNRSVVLPGAQSSAALIEAMHHCDDSMQAQNRLN